MLTMKRALQAAGVVGCGFAAYSLFCPAGMATVVCETLADESRRCVIDSVNFFARSDLSTGWKAFQALWVLGAATGGAQVGVWANDLVAKSIACAKDRCQNPRQTASMRPNV